MCAYRCVCSCIYRSCRTYVHMSCAGLRGDGSRPVRPQPGLARHGWIGEQGSHPSRLLGPNPHPTPTPTPTPTATHSPTPTLTPTLTPAPNPNPNPNPSHPYPWQAQTADKQEAVLAAFDALDQAEQRLLSEEMVLTSLPSTNLPSTTYQVRYQALSYQVRHQVRYQVWYQLTKVRHQVWSQLTKY